MKALTFIAIGLAVLALIFSFVALQSPQSFGGSTSAAWSAASFQVSGTEVISNSRGFSGTTISGTTGTFSSTLTVSGETTLEKLVLGGATTSLAAAATAISASEMCDNALIQQAPTASSVTLYLATSGALMGDCIPNPGDKMFTLYDNTAVIGSTVTLAASDTATILLEPTGGDVLVTDIEYAEISCLNIDDTNVACSVVTLQDAD
jgi:hypothetical protein